MSSPLGSLSRIEKTRRETLLRSELIPPLPDFVVRLLAQLDRPDTEPEDLESLVQGDPVLVAKMLAMVNSPFYGLNRTISTIRESIMVLGFRGLRSMVLATSTSRFLDHDHSVYGFTDKGLWTHSVAVATAARHLARVCGLGADAAEELFVAGLLHDIGKMILARYLVENGCELLPDESTVDTERRHLGIDHAEAGALVAAKWNLSEQIQEVLTQHHHPIPRDSHARPVALVRLANTFAHELGAGISSPRPGPRQPTQQDLDTLGLTPGDWRELRDELRTLVTTMIDKLADLVR